MAERNPPEFKFDADNQEPEEFYHEEMKDLRVEKLSQRLTLLTILLPCLMAVAIYFGYRDLTGRVHQDRDRGTLEVQKLSAQMENFSKQFNAELKAISATLSSHDQEFGNSIATKLNTITKNIGAITRNHQSLSQAFDQIKSNFEQTKNSIKELKDAKADRKDQSAAIARIKADLQPLKKELKALTEMDRELKAVSSEINDFKSQFNKELITIIGITENSKRDYDLLQDSIAKQLSEKIDKTALGVELLMFKKNQSTNSLAISELNQKLDALKKQIEDIQAPSTSNVRPRESSTPKVRPATTTAVDEASAKDIGIPVNSEDVKLEEQDLPPE